MCIVIFNHKNIHLSTILTRYGDGANTSAHIFTLKRTFRARCYAKISTGGGRGGAGGLGVEIIQLQREKHKFNKRAAQNAAIFISFNRYKKKTMQTINRNLEYLCL